MIQPIVADMAHFNPVDFAKIKAAGIRGVIHKASQGVGVTDQMFVPRRAQAKAAGLLFGRYSFATADDPVAHAKHFLAVGGRPDDDELTCLDFEDNPHSPMSGRQAYDFMRAAEDITGRLCWIYGGNRIAAHITPLAASSSAIADYFKARPLWLCQYKTGLGDVDLAALNKHIRVPAPWDRWTLLQYTGDGVGPLPHSVPGLENGADLNAFDGSDDALAAVWAGAAVRPGPAA